MTNQEVIEKLKYYKQANEDHNGYLSDSVHIDLAIKALEKDIPQKAVKTESLRQACPICHKAVSFNYCTNCGQRISYT